VTLFVSGLIPWHLAGSTWPGHHAVIRPGKPVYRTAFERLASDRVFSATQELSINAATRSTSESAIKSISSELVELSQLFLGSSGRWSFGGTHGVPVEVAQRVDVLLRRMEVEERKLVEMEKQAAELRGHLHEG
jgi:RNA12 protein